MKRDAAILTCLLLAACGLQWWAMEHAATPALDAVRYVDIARRFQADGLLATVREEAEHPLFPAIVWVAHEARTIWPNSADLSWAASAQCAAAGMLILSIIAVWLLLRELVSRSAAISGTLFYCVMSEVACLGADGLSDSTQLCLLAVAFWSLAMYWRPLAPRSGICVGGEEQGRNAGAERGGRESFSGRRQPSDGVRVVSRRPEKDSRPRPVQEGKRLEPDSAVKPRQSAWLLVAGLSSGLAMLARPESLVLLPVVAIVLGAIQCRARWRQPWRSVAFGMGSLAIGCSLVVAPYLMVSHSLAPAAAWSRLLGRHTIDSLEADARASFRPREVWNLPTGERMAFPVKESTTTSRFQGHAAAIAEYFKELPEAFHYWIGALAVVGLAARGIGLQPVGDSDRRHAGSPSHADRPTVGVQALACSPSPPAEAGIPTDRSWTTGLSKADGPFALFAAVYFIVHSAAVVYHAAGVGYLSPRHLLPLVLLGLGPAGRGAIALAQWLTVRVSPTRKRGEVPSDCIPASTSGPTAALAWAIVIASAAACLPRTLAPLHHSRMGHRQAGEWLAAASGPGPVLDTRGMTALYSGRMTYRYEAARRAFENPELAFVVVEERELGFESRRSRTLKHLLNGAAELVARFESPKRRAGEDVLLYRWRPERLAASLK